MNRLPTSIFWRCLAAFTVLSVTVSNGWCAPPADTPERFFDDDGRSFLARHCAVCHSGSKPKGDFSVNSLTADFAVESNRERWLAVAERLKSREMPPKPKPRPPEQDVLKLVDWIASSAARQGGGALPALRRLSRVEYENTIRDLLSIDVEVKEMLPLDSVAHGFDNVAEAQHTSSFLMERYLEAADVALDAAIASRPQPPMVNKRYFGKDERHVKSTTENVFRRLDDTLVLFSSSEWQAITLGQFYPRDRGRYRFRIAVHGFQSNSQPVTFRVEAGPMLMGQKNHLVGYFDAPADKPTVIEFTDYLEARCTIRVLPYGLERAHHVHQIGADKYPGVGLAIDWIEVEGPLHETWPPQSHRRLFGELPQKPARSYNQHDRVEVTSSDPRADAERILRPFVRRAFRRTVTDDDVAPFLALVDTKLKETSFEQAVRVALKAVLLSPGFLFLHEQSGADDDFALASRLSYFLWSTMPDEELLELAATRRLRDKAELRRQVERLLSHPKAASFTRNFVDQWLKLRDIDFTAPDPRLYPEFDDMLKVSMVQETHLFFDEVLKHDLSVASFVSSDFSMLNERLAKHYGIAGVKGAELRRVSLPAESHRGGVLTMASVLKVTANGTSTSPVVRGAWVLDRIVGIPPSPPPDGVPAIDPDIRGATTIRQQLARHREIASCAACHAKIDPPGFALENFDVIGGWRDHYRSIGRGESVVIDGRRMPYHKGLAVDAGDVLADGRKFANIDEFKRLLLDDKDQLTRSLAQKFLIYATGLPPTEADQAEIEAIVTRVREKGYGLRTLIHELVQSELFQGNGP